MVICCLEALLQPFNFPSLRSPDTRCGFKAYHDHEAHKEPPNLKEGPWEVPLLKGDPGVQPADVQESLTGPGLPTVYKVRWFIFICIQARHLGHWFRQPLATMLPSTPQVQSRLEAATTTPTGGYGLSRAVEGREDTPLLSFSWSCSKDEQGNYNFNVQLRHRKQEMMNIWTFIWGTRNSQEGGKLWTLYCNRYFLWNSLIAVWVMAGICLLLRPIG